MQLKEFSFISPVIEAALVFKAIETVISPEIIALELGQDKQCGRAQAQTAVKFSGLCA